MPAQHHRRAAVAGLAATALAAGALAASPAATALPPTDSPIRLIAPESMTVRSHDGYVYSDFGLEMAAQHQNFEIRANRASYDDPIVARWMHFDEEGNPVSTTDIPAEGMTSWQGLDGFLTVVVRKEGRKRPVSRQDMKGCFNSWESRAAAPDHASGNDYPYACPYNPYTQGSVMGIAKGYAVSALGEYGYYASEMEPGNYLVKATIAPEWQEFFGIAPEDASTVTAVKVRKGRGGWRPAEPAAPEPASELPAAPATAPTTASTGALDPAYAPDLESLPAFSIGMNRKGTSVRFGANVWNSGNGPLLIEGFEPDETGDARARRDGVGHLDAYQYFLDGDNKITGHQRVGEFNFHEGNHNHWHYEDFAAYTLLNDVDGEPGTEAVRSSKISFCLANTDAVDYTIPNADWRPENTDLSSDCGGRGATYLRQVLSAGSGDTYYQFRTGQAFRVGNLPDGDYWISVEANPFGRLQELDTENNQTLRKITLTTNKRGVRKVVAEQVGVIDESWDYYREMRNAG